MYSFRPTPQVLSSLLFHFAKLRHNTTVYAREGFSMEAVVAPYYRKPFK